jgi:GT2 family glycosyltransferase
VKCSAVVVVDDASTDDSVAIVRREYPECRLVVSKTNVGPCIARNLGIEYARANLDFDAVLFLDNDAFLEPTALGELLGKLQGAPDVGIAVPKAYQDYRARTLHLAGELKADFYRGTVTNIGGGETDRGQHDEPRFISACSGFTMLVRDDALDRVGGFDEAFRAAAWEDLDFAMRVSKRGFKIAYVPTAVVEHVGGRRGRGTLLDREEAKVRNWILLMRRHASPVQWAAAVVVFPLRAAALFFRDLREDGPKAVGAHLRGLWRAVRDSRGGRRTIPED